MKTSTVAVALVSLSLATSGFSQAPKALPAEVQASLASELKGADQKAAEKAVVDAIKKNPSLAADIVAAAVKILAADPATKGLVAGVVDAAVAAVPNSQKPNVLNAARTAAGDDAGLIAALDAVAVKNKLTVSESGEDRYVAAELADSDFSGDQSVITQGAAFPNGSSGGSGNPANAGNDPAPAS